jgi:signal peptidase II
VVGGAILLVGLSLFGYDFDVVGRRRSGAEQPTESAEARTTAKHEPDTEPE